MNTWMLAMHSAAGRASPAYTWPMDALTWYLTGANATGTRVDDVCTQHQRRWVSYILTLDPASHRAIHSAQLLRNAGLTVRMLQSTRRNTSNANYWGGVATHQAAYDLIRCFSYALSVVRLSY